MHISHPTNRTRAHDLRRISPYNGYNFGAKDVPNGFTANNAPIFVPKRNHPKYYYALTNMRNTIDYVKNQENFEHDFKDHLKDTGVSTLGKMVIREYDNDVEKYGKGRKKKVQWGSYTMD